MSAPVWLGATSGQAGQAGQVNQFLAAHATTYLYQGALQANVTTSGAAGDHSNGLWLAQSFTTSAGQTAVGYVMIMTETTGAPPLWTLSIQANSAGVPSGTPLVTALLPKEFVSGAAYGWVAVPLPVTGLTASTQYWLVANAAGDASDYYHLHYSASPSGASTSTNGTTWTAQGYGYQYQVYDQAAVLPLAGTWEDSGARWTWMSYTSGLVTGLQEYTAGQTAAGYTAGTRALSYSSGLLTGVA